MTEDEMVGCRHRLMSLSKLREIVKDREALGAAFLESQRVRHDSVSEQQQLICVSLFVAVPF